MRTIHQIISYMLKGLFQTIGVASNKSVRLARRLAWLVIELVVVLAFLYLVAFLAASVGMYVVEKQTETRQVDTIHGVHIKKYNVNPNR